MVTFIGSYTCQLVNGAAEWELDGGSCHDKDMNSVATVALSTSSPEALALAVADLLEAGTIDPPMALGIMTDVVIEESGTISIEEEGVRL